MNISAESSLVLTRLRPPFARSAYVLFPYTNEGRVNDGMTFETIVAEPAVAAGAGMVKKVYTALPDWQTKDADLKRSTVKHVIIDHGSKVSTITGGFSTVAVYPGQTVNRGDKLGDLFTNELFLSISLGSKTLNPCAINSHWLVQNGNVVTGQSGKIRFAPDRLVRDLSKGIGAVISSGLRYFSDLIRGPQLLVSVVFNGDGTKTGPGAISRSDSDYWNVYTPVDFFAVASTACNYYYYFPGSPPVNTPPTAHNQSVSTDEDVPVGVTLTGSDFETFPGNLIFNLGVLPAYGILTGVAPNLTYTPSLGYFGADSFLFTVTDDGAPPLTSAPAMVSITVNQFPPPVPNTPPFALDQTLSTNQNVPLVLVLTGGDSETLPGSLIYAVTALPAHGLLTGIAPNLTYTPNTGYTGADSFEFSVTDDGLPPLTSPVDGLIQITVIPVMAANTPPFANDQMVDTDQDVAVAITLTGGDAETLLINLVYAVTTPPVHGVLTGTAPNLTYTPSLGYFGPDSFEFSVTDDGTPNLTSPVLGLIQITVNEVVGANTPPIAYAQSLVTDQATNLPIILTGSDLETPVMFLIFNITSAPGQGSLIGAGSSVIYKPNGSYKGVDTFKFTVTDTGSPPLTSAEAIISINVTAPPPPPYPNPDPFPCVGDTTTINDALKVTDPVTLETNWVMISTGALDPLTYLAVFGPPGCAEAWAAAAWDDFIFQAIPYSQARLIWQDSVTTGDNWMAIQVFPDQLGNYHHVFPLSDSTKIVVEYCPP